MERQRVVRHLSCGAKPSSCRAQYSVLLPTTGEAHELPPSSRTLAEGAEVDIEPDVAANGGQQDEPNCDAARGAAARRPKLQRQLHEHPDHEGCI